MANLPPDLFNKVFPAAFGVDSNWKTEPQAFAGTPDYAKVVRVDKKRNVNLDWLDVHFTLDQDAIPVTTQDKQIIGVLRYKPTKGHHIIKLYLPTFSWAVISSNAPSGPVSEDLVTVKLDTFGVQVIHGTQHPGGPQERWAVHAKVLVVDILDEAEMLGSKFDKAWFWVGHPLDQYLRHLMNTAHVAG